MKPPAGDESFQRALLRGAKLAEQERFDEAAVAFREAVQVQPRAAHAHLALAYALSRAGRASDAERSARTSLALRESPDAHAILAQALNLQKRFADAEPSARRAIALRPGDSTTLNVLGISLHGLERFDEAETTFRRAIELDPHHADLLANYGRLAHAMRRHNEAISLFDRAISLRPNDRAARFALAGTLLLNGDYARGFREFENRWAASDLAGKSRTFDKPLWDGSPLDGRTILVHAEQGFGDLFQFARFLTLVIERGAGKLIVEAQPSAAELMRSVDGVSEVATRDDTPSDRFDVYAPLMSLPMILGTTLQSLPNNVPYLRVDARRTAIWRDRLQHLKGKRIGIVWAGNREHERDEQRSIRSSWLLPLARVPDVSFVSLQLPRDTRAKPEHLPLFDPTPDIGDFSDTAAILENLDLLIAVDTAVVHLAGALARPVWTLIDTDNDWRWLLEREDSPWYPTMRLFRQRVRGDWRSVIERVRDALIEVTRT